MNLSNQNFQTFFSALGLNTEYVGQLTHEEILTALDLFDPRLCVRSNEVTEGPNGALTISFGIDIVQAEVYQTTLRRIALFAKTTDSTIVWG